jgi:ribosome-binding protein aMBF1 (putative translation factor)
MNENATERTTDTPVAPAPMSDTAIKEDTHPGPQRFLNPRLANAIRVGKERTGLSWRGLAAETGISTAHLNHMSLGKRVPSRRVVGILINALDLDYETAKALRDVAAPTWWERRVERL